MGRTEGFIAEALGRAHAALLEDLRKLEAASGAPSGEGTGELRAWLGATREHVAEHFRFEEQNGYMEAVRQREPRLERTVQQLAEEHGRLLQSLDALVAEAGTAANLGEALRERIRGWVERLRRHEIRETDLVQVAFNLDLGAED